MRLELVICSTAFFVGVAYGGADLALCTSLHFCEKSFLALCPEFDQEIEIRAWDEQYVRGLLEKRGNTWEPMLGSSTKEILAKWKAPSKIRLCEGIRGLDSPWNSPHEEWIYDGYSLLFDQQHHCFYVSPDGIYH